MWLKNKIAQYKNYKYGVKHCTFNPEGPGVVRIHLVPPRFKLFGSAPHIVILNGYYLLPIGYSWAILLSAFIDEVNKYDGLPIDNEAEYDIFERTVNSAHRVFPGIKKNELEEDLDEVLTETAENRETVKSRLKDVKRYDYCVDLSPERSLHLCFCDRGQDVAVRIVPDERMEELIHRYTEKTTVERSDGIE